MLKHFKVEGNNYECGYQIGTALKSVIQARVNRLVPNELFIQFKQELRDVEKICELKYPHLVMELRGISDGSGIEFGRLLLLNCEEMRDSEKGCTTIAKISSNEISITHNEDTGDSSGDSREDCALISYQIGELSFTSFVYAGELPGSAYNWNNYGFYFSVNYLEPINTILDNERVPRNFTARGLIEARNIDSAINYLNNANDASGYHYLIGFENKIYSIEQNLDKVSAICLTENYIHSNHYIHPGFLYNKELPLSTKYRLERGNHMIKDGYHVLRILSDRENEPYTICRLSDDNGLTLSTVMFNATENRVTIYTPSSLKVEYIFNMKE